MYLQQADIMIKNRLEKLVHQRFGADAARILQEDGLSLLAIGDAPILEEAK